MKPILKIVAICVICAATLMSGCMGYTETAPVDPPSPPESAAPSTYVVPTIPNTQHVVMTPPPAVPITSNVDFYEDGMHITGKMTMLGDECIGMDCIVDGYADGHRVTGTMTMGGAGEPYYKLSANVDTYESGFHLTGVLTCAGTQVSSDDWRGALAVEGYAMGNRVTGTGTMHDGRCHFDIYTNVDTYKDGGHLTGSASLKGYDSNAWQYDLTFQKTGYLTQYLRGGKDAEWRT